jgi:hypothetical protein
MVEIMFQLSADFPAGGISNVPGILMKQAEQTTALPLAGRGKGHARFLSDRPVERRRGQGAQSLALERARLVRHPRGLQQQPPGHSLHV